MHLIEYGLLQKIYSSSYSSTQVVEPLRSLKVNRNDVNIFLRQYTLAVTEAGLGSAVDGGPKQLATLLMDNEVKQIDLFLI